MNSLCTICSATLNLLSTGDYNRLQTNFMFSNTLMGTSIFDLQVASNRPSFAPRDCGGVVGTNYLGQTGFTSLNSWNTMLTSTSEVHMVFYHQEKLSDNLKDFLKEHPSISKVTQKHLSNFLLLFPLTSMTQMKNVK